MNLWYDNMVKGEMGLNAGYARTALSLFYFISLLMRTTLFAVVLLCFLKEVYIWHKRNSDPNRKNMPLRLLGYAARTLEKMVPDMSIYSSAQQQFPIPEFYVLYTGETPWNQKFLRLSDGFLRHSNDEEIPENSLELVVKVIDVGYNENNELIRRSKTLEGYSRLIHYVKEHQKQGMAGKMPSIPRSPAA